MADSRPSLNPTDPRPRAAGIALQAAEERRKRSDQDAEQRYQRDRNLGGRHSTASDLATSTAAV